MLEGRPANVFRPHFVIRFLIQRLQVDPPQSPHPPRKPKGTSMTEIEDKEYELILMTTVAQFLSEFILHRPGRNYENRQEWRDQWDVICTSVSKKCCVSLDGNTASKNLFNVSNPSFYWCTDVRLKSFLQIITRYEKDNDGSLGRGGCFHPWSHKCQCQIFNLAEPHSSRQ